MVFMNGTAIPGGGPHGEAIVDDTFLLCFNAHYEPLSFKAPAASYGARWRRVLDTADPELAAPIGELAAQSELTLERRSMMVLQRIE
jgi:glycogen operon protein